MKKSKKIAFLFLLFLYSLIWTIDMCFKLTQEHNTELSIGTEKWDEKEVETLYIFPFEMQSNTSIENKFIQKPIVILDTFKIKGICLKKVYPPPKQIEIISVKSV